MYILVFLPLQVLNIQSLNCMFICLQRREGGGREGCGLPRHGNLGGAKLIQHLWRHFWPATRKIDWGGEGVKI